MEPQFEARETRRFNLLFCCFQLLLKVSKGWPHASFTWF